MSTPFFSIITVSFNAENIIYKTIQSALNQTFKDFEIIVKDGKSRDNTINSIPKDEKIKVFSESDNGIYDAMNRAIEISSGKYLIFMNTGDLFADENVLEKIYNEIEDNEDIIYGNYIVGDNIHQPTNKITDFYLYRTPLCHQSIFFKKELFQKLGLYDCKYKILADYDFTLKARMSGAKFKYTDTAICKYLGGGVSETKEGNVIKEKERKDILKKNFPLVSRLRYDIFLILSFRKFRIWLISGHSPEWFKKFYFKLVNKINTK